MRGSISISGLGIICAIGNDSHEVLDSLLEGKGGIRGLKYLNTKHKDIPVGEVQLSNSQMKELLALPEDSRYSRTSMMGAIAVKQAMKQAGISGKEGKRIVLISGTTVGNMDMNEFGDTDSGNDCGQSSLDIVKLSGLDGARCCTICTACSAALNAIMVGAEMLSHDEADIVIAGGSEALTRYHLNGFNTLMICDRERCRPFDDTRAGLNLGEGAGFVVLERKTEKALAYIGGYGNHCDAYHQTASSPEGEGAFLAMRDALDMAGLNAGDIQYVNAHGTGTVNNDLSESRALQRIFGENMPEISSTKAFTGHTTSASGSIEAIICVLAMQNSFTPANLGWSHPIEGGIRPTRGKKGVILENVMCNAFGFGGNDSSMVFCSKEKQIGCTEDNGFSCRQAACETVCNEIELQALKEFISPIQTRRMSKIMKAAMLSAIRALNAAGLEKPDAIISATSGGMQELSSIFLHDIIANDEELLKPTVFMQSTHNTIGSAIAIRCGCHGYNITYSQLEESGKWATADAERLIRDGKAASVLIVAFDETHDGAFTATSTILTN